MGLHHCPPPRAYVFMWHGGSDPSTQQRCANRYEHLIKPLVEQAGYSVERLKDGEHTIAGPWPKRFIDAVYGCNVVVADVTGDSTSVGYEIGFASALGIPVVCVYDKEDGTSSPSAWIRNEHIWEIRDQRAKITEALRAFLPRPALEQTRKLAHGMLISLAEARPLSEWSDDVLAAAFIRAGLRVTQVLEGRRRITNRTKAVRARHVFERVLTLMKSGDVYLTVTNRGFWKLLGDGFLAKNRDAAADGKTIKRIWLLADEDRADRKFVEELGRHQAIESRYPQRITNRVISGQIADLRRDWGHFAIVNRGGDFSDLSRSMVLVPESHLSGDRPPPTLDDTIDIIQLYLCHTHDMPNNEVSLRIAQFDAAYAKSKSLTEWLHGTETSTS